MKYTAKFIDESLRAFYDNQSKYMVSNIYIFHHLYRETDFFLMKSNNQYCYDIEIKVSRADFSADFNKEVKHSILANGNFKLKHGSSEVLDNGKRKKFKAGQYVPTNNRPNRFYFAVPENLVSVEEVPDYAGLLYINKRGEVRKVKEGKLLHRDILDIDSKLCRKFYFYWKNAIEVLETVKKELKSCKKRKK